MRPYLGEVTAGHLLELHEVRTSDYRAKQMQPCFGHPKPARRLWYLAARKAAFEKIYRRFHTANLATPA